MAFYAKISPTFSGHKFQIPTPTLCPEERQRRRQSFKNEKRLYKRRCDATGEQIISIYSPDKAYKVYTNKYRRSDARNPMDYGQDFDFTKTFTNNFTNLSNNVPKDQLTKEFLKQENCNYTNAA
jgi:spore coat polysaccharide biosynthesis protein SpsF (cytidylyltransferase family)